MTPVESNFRNAIGIKFRNIFFSTAIKLTLIFVTLLSAVVSFWPAISNALFTDSEVYVASNVNLGEMENENIVIVDYDDEDPDIIVAYNVDDGKYNITVRNENAMQYEREIVLAISSKNLSEFLQNNPSAASEDQLALLTNDNITTEIDFDEDEELSEDQFFFMMATGIIALLYLVLLIIRVGAEVGFEKGNKVTEIILTSITNKQLFYAHVLGTALCIFLSFIIIFSPMAVAYMINNTDYTLDLSFLTPRTLIFSAILILITAIILMVSAIAICSIVKQSEDAGPSILLIMIPVFISYFHFTLTMDVYSGIFAFLNYIPLISLFQNFGAILRDLLENVNLFIIFGIHLAFLFLVYKLGKILFIRNISNN